MSGQNNSAVYGFSSDTHELIDYFKAPQNEMITCMDAIMLEDVNPIFVYGTSTQGHDDFNTGKILLRKNWTTLPQSIEVDRAVTDLKFSPDNEYIICGTGNGSVYIIKHHEGHLIAPSRPSTSLDKEIVVSINFSDQGNSVILTSAMRKHYRMNIKNPEKREELEEKDIFNISIANLTYHNQMKMTPVCIGQEVEYIVSTRGEVIEFWKSLSDLETSCSVRVCGHASEVYKLQISNSKNWVYSLGRNDNCLVEWKIDYDLTSKDNDLKESKDSHTIASDDAEENQKINREQNFCLSMNEKTLNYRDTMTMIRGTTVKLLNALNYKDKKLYDERSYVKKRVPPLSITLKHVYGIEVVFIKRGIRPKKDFVLSALLFDN